MKIYGIITDAAEEKPLAKAKVVLHIGEIELVTFYSDKDGEFQVEQKLDQHIGETLICHVEKDNFNPREVTYKIGDEDIRLDIELVPIEHEKPIKPPKEEVVPPPPSPPPPPPPSNTKWLKIAIAVGALIAAGILVYFLIPGKPGPEIVYFKANPSSITRGNWSTLSWETSDAKAVEIDPMIGSVQASGSRRVNPGKTSTYTLTARNQQGQTMKRITVTVRTLQRPRRDMERVVPRPEERELRVVPRSERELHVVPRP